MSAGAQTVDATAFEPVLLPMHNGATAGANFSQWQVDEVISASGPEIIRYFPCYPAITRPEDPPSVCFVNSTLERSAPDITKPAYCRICRYPTGAILWVTRGTSERLAAYDRVHELTHDWDNFGTVVPAVREHDFRRGPTSFHRVPVSENFRSTLRIYNLRETPLMVRISVVGAEGNVSTVITEQTVQVGPAFGSDPPPTVPLLPGYASISVDALFPAGYTGVAGGAGLPAGTHIEVTPVTQDVLYWAFMSVTSNSDQRVTVLLP